MSDFLDKIVLKTDSQAIKLMADMRWMSDATGQVYETQVNQLKYLANLIFSPKVAVISISQDDKFVKVESESGSTKLSAKFPSVVSEILGDSWTTQMVYDVKRKKTNRTAKSRGKKRSGTARKHAR